MPSKQKQKRKQRQERYASNVSTSSMDVDTSETESVAGSKSGRPTGGSKKVQQRINAGEQSVRARGLTGIGEICTLCDSEIGDNGLILLCKHAFHRNHIMEWLRTAEEQQCPNCEKEVRVCVLCQNNIYDGAEYRLFCGHFMHKAEYLRWIKNHAQPKCPLCDTEHTDFCVGCHGLWAKNEIMHELDCGHLLHDGEWSDFLKSDKKCPLCGEGAKNQCQFCHAVAEYGKWDIRCDCGLSSHAGKLIKWLREHDGKCPNCSQVHRNFCFVCGNLFKHGHALGEVRLECCDTKYHQTHLNEWMNKEGQRCPKCGHEIDENYRLIQRGGGGNVGSSTNKICTICGQFCNHAKEQFQVACCMSIFHIMCWDNWRQEETKCPECQQDIVDPISALSQRCKKCKWLLPAGIDGTVKCMNCAQKKQKESKGTIASGTLIQSTKKCNQCSFLFPFNATDLDICDRCKNLNFSPYGRGKSPTPPEPTKRMLSANAAYCSRCNESTRVDVKPGKNIERTTDPTFPYRCANCKNPRGFTDVYCSICHFDVAPTKSSELHKWIPDLGETEDDFDAEDYCSEIPGERYPGEFDDILTVQNDAILEDMGKKMAKVELGESKESR